MPQDETSGMSKFYYRPDGARMIEVAPHEYVNESSALALGLVSRRSNDNKFVSG